MKSTHLLRSSVLGIAAALLFSIPLQGQAKRSQAARDGVYRHHQQQREPSSGLRMGDSVSTLIAVLQPTAGNEAHGTVVFERQGRNEVRITARVRGLEPNAEHAIHVHEFGDMRSDDGTSAGGHYNPEGHPHALPHAAERHAGDFGNLEADSNGEAVLTLTVDNISLAGRNNPVIGRAVIVHAQPDDGGQPTGNAGPRIAAGVIGVVNPDID